MQAETSDQGNQGLVLYSGAASSASQRVRIALHFKGLKFEIKARKAGSSAGYDDPELARLNPRKQVPVLCVDGAALSESSAIVEYLEECYPEPPLLPKDPKQRAVVRKIAQSINAGVQPLQNSRVLNYVEEKLGEGAGLQWAQHWIHLGLSTLEEFVVATAGKYCVGDSVTLADVYLAPQFENAARYKLDTSAYPTLKRVAEALESHPAFHAARPENHPAPPSLD